MARKQKGYTTGEKGRSRVRAFKDNKTGMVLLEFYERRLGTIEPKRVRVSTHTRDMTLAKQKANELAAALSRNEPPPSTELTLQRLFDIYIREVTPSKGESKRKHDHRCAEMFITVLGANRKPSTLNRRDWDRFVRERLSGQVAPKGVTRPKAVRSRVVEYDLKWLLSVLNWATMAGDSHGGVLLERNPLRGCKVSKDDTPVRAVIVQEQYESLLDVADQVATQFKLALIIAHETGHRIGAVRLLRWADIDFEAKTIRWRGENDKMGFEHSVALTETTERLLIETRRARLAIGDGWVFPSPGDPEVPCSRHLVRDWWERGAKLVGLPKGQRLGWHSLRRKFATEMKDTPLPDLCQLGGWKSPQTILMCYQQPDAARQREALASRRVLRATGS